MHNLDDARLVKFLVDTYPKITFFSDATIKEYIEDIKKIADKDDYSSPDLLRKIFNPSYEESIDVLDFWERLLIDALMFLKWHDLTEFPIKDRNNPAYVRPSTREDAYKKMTEGSLFVFKLKDYFKAFIDFERLLYGAEQFYRDHVYHIIRVWLTGALILHEYINDKFKVNIFEAEDGDLCDDIVKKIEEAKSIKLSSKSNGLLYEGEEDAMWCLIALTHDLGYPLSKVEKINTSLRKMMSYFVKTGLEEFSFSFPQQNQFIHDAILRYLSSKIVRHVMIKSKETSIEFKTHIQAKYYLKFSQSFERFDHGIISCIALVKNLIYFQETNFDWDDIAVLRDVEEARQFLIRREILRAIASHTCPEIYHWAPNTFAFLLLLSDELQFWGRPTFEALTLGVHKHYSVRLTDFSGNNVSFEIKTEPKPDVKPESLMGFFKTKASLFKQILRVAVDSSGRNFTLSFRVADDKGTTYEFEALPLEKSTMKLNGHIVEYKQLEKLVHSHEQGPQKYCNLQELIGKFELFPERWPGLFGQLKAVFK